MAGEDGRKEEKCTRRTFIRGQPSNFVHVFGVVAHARVEPAASVPHDPASFVPTDVRSCASRVKVIHQS